MSTQDTTNPTKKKGHPNKGLKTPHPVSGNIHNPKKKGSK